MRERIRRLLRKTGGALPNLVSQAAVSVAATVAAALLTQFVVNTQPASKPPSLAIAAAPAILDARAGANLLHAQFTETGYRLRPSYPTEFAAVFGPAPDRPHRELAAAEWSPAATPAAARTAAKPAAVAQACGEACKRRALAASVLPPPRPASLAVAATETAPAVVAAAPQDERVRLLGVRLPGFVPSGEKIVKTVVSWSGAVTGLVDGM